MKSLSLVILVSITSSAFAGDYLSEKEVRNTCLRSFSRTITCTAVAEGKFVKRDMDKESIKAMITDYFEFGGKAVTGFTKKEGLFSNPSWRFICNPKTGALEQTKYIIRNRIDTEHTAKAVCR